LSLSLYSQNSNLNGAVIHYKILNNTGRPNTLDAILFVNGQVTIHLPKYSTKVLNDAKQEAKEKNKMTFDPFYTKVDHKAKEILFFESIGQQLFLIKDDYNQLKWDITEEIKTIGGYQSVKATTIYRGRKWVAWFAPEIPLPYGPWKLHGLPGLITEAYDETGMYTWRIEKIEYRRDGIFDKEFSSLVETKNTKPISVKQYLEDGEEYDTNVEAEMRQMNPSMGAVVKAPRGGYELKYEWEE